MASRRASIAKKLARSWTRYRNVFFTSSRSGYSANSFDQIWRQRHGGRGAPLVLQMLLDDAIKLLSVPADFTREGIISAFLADALLRSLTPQR